MTSKTLRAPTYAELLELVAAHKVIILPEVGEVYVRRNGGLRRCEIPDRDGYLRTFVTGGSAGERFCLSTQRVVWMVHHGMDVPSGLEVDHKDLCVTNNVWRNLEAVTPRENIRRAIQGGAFDPHRSRPTLRGAKAINPEDVPGILDALERGESLGVVAARHNVTRGAITAIATGRTFSYVCPERRRRGSMAGGRGTGRGGFRGCKLTHAQKAAVADELRGGARQCDLAAKHNVTRATVCLIAKAHGVPHNRPRQGRPQIVVASVQVPSNVSTSPVPVNAARVYDTPPPSE